MSNIVDGLKVIVAVSGLIGSSIGLHKALKAKKEKVAKTHGLREIGELIIELNYTVEKNDRVMTAEDHRDVEAFRALTVESTLMAINSAISTLKNKISRFQFQA